MFSVGQRVKIKIENPGDKKRIPNYIKGKTGVVHAVRGRFVNPVDHLDARPTTYSIMFQLDEILPDKGINAKVFVDVFEDWMLSA